MYNLLLWLLLPLAFISSRRREHRLSVTQPNHSAPPEPSYEIWLHAASLGEMLLAELLVQELIRSQPQLRLVLTTNTPAGLKKAQTIAAQYPSQCAAVYAPYDLPYFIRRFLRRFAPQRLITMEAELWRNRCIVCAKAKLPLVLANARLSASSLRRRQRLSFAQPPAATLPSLVLAQSEADAVCLRELYSRREDSVPYLLEVCGNMKFDLQPSPAAVTSSPQLRLLIEQLPSLAARLWCAASTHAPEEELLLKSQAKLGAANLLILAPRHAKRFAKVARLLRRRRLRYLALSELTAENVHKLPQCQVLLVDTLGELALLYPLVEFVFVGGSFAAQGGHNILEPLRHAKPVLLGPQHTNLAAILPLFAKAAVCITKSPLELTAKLSEYLHMPPAQLSQLAKTAPATIEAQQGVSAKTAAKIL